MMFRILLAPAVLILLASGGFPGGVTALAAGMEDRRDHWRAGMEGGDIAELRFRQWREPFRPFVYPEYPPVWYSGPQYRFQRDRDSNAYERRKCARTTGYRTDDYYRCVGPWWWPFLR